METKIEEVWKDVIGYEGKYEVSDLGRIRNIRTGRTLKLYGDRKGYIRMSLANGKIGDLTKLYLHRLVLLAFNIPNPYNKPDVNHINGIPWDNRLVNLEWATRLENIRHALQTGLSAKSRKHVKLNAATVIDIRSKYTPRTRGLLSKLMTEYKLTRKHLTKILYREIWRHV